MSQFTDHLKDYMEENNITPAELARELNMERSTVFRYIKGIRIPTDKEIVDKIADALRMTLADKEILIEEYDRLVLGEQVVDSYKYVKSMFENLKSINKELSQEIPENFFRNTEIPEKENVILKSKKEIETCIFSLLFWFIKEQEKENTLSLLMQPIYPFVQETVVSLFGRTEKKIEQIICLEQRFSKSFKNLEIFYSILPMCFAAINYDVRYYYEFMEHHINQLSWLPNIIIAYPYVLQFDYEMENGILIKNENYAKAMKAQYVKMQEKTLSFFVQGKDMGDVFDIVRSAGKQMPKKDEEAEETIVLYREPYFEICMPKSEDWNGITYCGDKKQKIISCFKREGIRSFMETGIIRGIPSDFCEPIDMQDRKMLLKRMIHLMQENIAEYYIIEDDMELPAEICFCWSEKTQALSINIIKDNKDSHITITDHGVCQTFKQFFEYIKKKGLLYSKEENISILRRVVEEY